jgi:hypothetical protein
MDVQVERVQAPSCKFVANASGCPPEDRPDRGIRVVANLLRRGAVTVAAAAHADPRLSPGGALPTCSLSPPSGWAPRRSAIRWLGFTSSGKMHAMSELKPLAIVDIDGVVADVRHRLRSARAT